MKRPLGNRCSRSGLSWIECDGLRWCWGYISKADDDPLDECTSCERFHLNREHGFQERLEEMRYD